MKLQPFLHLFVTVVMKFRIYLAGAKRIPQVTQDAFWELAAVDGDIYEIRHWYALCEIMELNKSFTKKGGVNPTFHHSGTVDT